MKPPNYYRKLLELDEQSNDSTTWVKPSDRYRGLRVRKAKKHAADNTPARLAVREKVQVARLTQLKRGLE